MSELNNNKSNPIYKILAFFIVAIMAATLALGLYWTMWPVDVLQIRYIKILTPVVKAGDDVRYEICYDKYKDLAGYITKTLTGLDENDKIKRYALSSVTGAFEPGTDQCVEESTRIPNYVTPGEYRVKYRAVYQINPLHILQEDFETLCFKVIKSKSNN